MTELSQNRSVYTTVLRGSAIALVTLVTLLLTVANLFFPSLPTDGLDPSWQLVLNHARGSDLIFGSDLVYTYGPWGWLSTLSYHSTNFGERMLWEVLLKSLAAALAVVAANHLSWPRRLALLAAALLVAPLFQDTVPMLLIAGLIVWITHQPRALTFIAAAGALIGFLALQKFTYLIIACAGLGFATLQLASLHQRRELATLAVSTVLTFLLGWCAAGQPLVALPFFLQHASWVAAGYGEAMFLNESNSVFFFGLGSAVFFLILIWDSVTLSRAVPALALTCLAFISWKHGFVRADGHTLGFFSTMLFAGICAPWLNPISNFRRSTASWALCLTAVGGLFAAEPQLASNTDLALRQHLAAKVRALTNLSRFQFHADRGIAALRAEHALPAIRARVGSAPIDQFGYQQAVLLLNDFNYRPRPVFQSFQAYSGPLARLNETAYLVPSAPAFTLARLQAIDGRYPALEDAALLPRLVLDHALDLTESGFLLLKRQPQPSSIHHKPLVSGRLRYRTDHAELPVSQHALWATIDTPLSWLGRLRSLLYKPPELTLVLRDTHGVDCSFRLIAPAARAGFLLSPLLVDTADLEKLVSRREGSPVHSFRIDIHPQHARFFQSHATYEISSLSPLTFSPPSTPVPPAR